MTILHKHEHNGKGIVTKAVELRLQTLSTDSFHQHCIEMFRIVNNLISNKKVFCLTFQTCNRTEKLLLGKTWYDVEGIESKLKLMETFELYIRLNK